LAGQRSKQGVIVLACNLHSAMSSSGRFFGLLFFGPAKKSDSVAFGDRKRRRQSSTCTQGFVSSACPPTWYQYQTPCDAHRTHSLASKQRPQKNTALINRRAC